MSIYLKLTLFGLENVVSQVIISTASSAMKYVGELFTDQSQNLPQALCKANDRAWKTLAIALAGDGWFDSLKTFFIKEEEKALAEQVRAFLKSNPLRMDCSSAQFSKDCLADLNAARQAGLLSSRNLTPGDIAKGPFPKRGDSVP